MPAHAAHGLCVFVVHLAPHEAAQRLVLRGGKARTERWRRPVEGVEHAERPEYMRVGIVVQRFARDHRDKRSKRDEPKVAVDDLRAGPADRASPFNRIDDLRLPLEALIEVAYGRQAARVRQEVAHGDGALADAPESGEIGPGRSVEVDPARLDELQDGRRGGHHLGERGKIEDGRGGRGNGVRPPLLERTIEHRIAVSRLLAYYP